MSEREPRNLQHQADRARGRRQPNVLGYLAILFVVAFLLLGFAYLQQQRQNAETTDALKQSASAVQTIQNVMAENEKLQDRVEALERRAAEQDEALLQAFAQTTEAQNAIKAMGYFWQIDEAYVRGRYTLCRQLIKEFEANYGPDYLPTYKVPDNDRFSPFDRYQEIYKALY